MHMVPVRDLQDALTQSSVCTENGRKIVGEPLTEEAIESKEFEEAFKQVANMDQKNGSSNASSNADDGANDWAADFNKGSLQCSSTEYGQQADLKILQTLNRQSSREAFPYLLQAAESQQQMI